MLLFLVVVLATDPVFVYCLLLSMLFVRLYLCGKVIIVIVILVIVMIVVSHSVAIMIVRLCHCQLPLSFTLSLSLFLIIEIVIVTNVVAIRITLYVLPYMNKSPQLLGR